MGNDSGVNEILVNNFDLLCSIIKQNTPAHQMKADLSKIDAIINKKIPETLKKHAPEDFYELFVDFKAEYERFRNFILYDKLIGKNIVALGGGLSSGKSSFINSLMGKKVLPADVDPSTSVPTYIVKGTQHEVVGINVFDSKVPMHPRDIKKIAHGFGEVEDDDDEKVTSGVTLGHVLKTLFFSTPLHNYDSIAFLDTPGYSQPGSEKYSVKTDEQSVRGQLNSSNFILWFVQADVGTITEKDIKFIKSLRNGIPMLVIVNKADMKTLDELSNIIAKIKSTLEIKGVTCVDVLAFSNQVDWVDDCELATFIANDIEKIRQHLDEWNSQVYESNFAVNFKKIFVRCKDFYEDEIDAGSRQLDRLNTSLTKLSAKNIEAETLEPLQLMVKQTRHNVDDLKAVYTKLKEVQREFFTEIKFVADVVGIGMPEPSEIDLLQEKGQNPWQLLEDYKREHDIQTNSEMVDMLQNMFADIEPRIERFVGEREYREEMVRIMQETCTVDPSEIRINDYRK